jgi:pyruvate dehydrogenase E2 component (dihydrolipoamide acetyltransferase)
MAGTRAGSGFTGKITATPAARRIARERNIDLSKVKATGRYGEVKAADVLAHKGVLISPLARRAAEANGIDPAAITGSGYRGKVLMQDVASRLSMGGPGRMRQDRFSAPARPIPIGITADGRKSRRKRRTKESGR